MLKKIIVFYHKDCWDGFSGAWAAWKKLGNKAEYIGLQPGAAPDIKVRGKEVYMIDTAFPIPVMKKVLKDNRKVVVLDHHLSNRDKIEFTTDSVYEMDHSGAVIAWNYFHSGKKVPRLLRHVEDVDIWKWKVPHSAEISVVMEGVKMDFKVWDKAVRNLENDKNYKEAIKKGANMLEYSNRMVERIVKKAQVVKFEGQKCLAVNTPVLNSEVGHRMVQLMPHISISWSEKEDKKVFSLRSDGKADVSKLAQRYGGGGHKAASGFSLPREAKLPWKFIKPYSSS